MFQCVFLLDPNYPSYVKGEKQYGFNFIEVLMEMREDGYVVDFSLSIIKFTCANLTAVHSHLFGFKL